jgi:MFS family permease
MARLADRFGKGIRTAPRDALIADVTSAAQRGRAFGFHRAMDHAGAAIGPLLAALFLWLRPGDLRSLFSLSLLPGLGLLALLWFGLPKSAPAISHFEPEPLTLTMKPFDSRFRGFLAALVLFTLGNSSDAFLLVRAEQLEVPVVWLPVLWCVFHIVKSAGNWWLGGRVDRHGPRGLIVLGWSWYAAVYLLFAMATEAWHVWVLFLLYAVFYALTEPAEKTLVANLVGPERRGLAFGWFNFAIGIATLPASVLFGFLYDRWGSFAAFGTGAGLSLAASLLLLWVTRPHADHADEAR